MTRPFERARRGRIASITSSPFRRPQCFGLCCLFKGGRYIFISSFSSNSLRISLGSGNIRIWEAPSSFAGVNFSWLFILWYSEPALPIYIILSGLLFWGGRTNIYRQPRYDHSEIPALFVNGWISNPQLLCTCCITYAPCPLLGWSWSELQHSKSGSLLDFQVKVLTKWNKAIVKQK